MWAIVGYTESQDSATLVNVAALADQSVRVNGDDIIIPRGLNFLLGAYALGPNVTRAQLLSPSLRRVFNQEIGPIDVAALPTSPVPFNLFAPNILELDEDEALNAQAAEDAAGASRATVLVLLGDGPIEPVTGDLHTVRVTGATTLVANAWTNGALTFDQTLPAGRYQLVGARMRSTNLQAFRFVFIGGTWRPGSIGNALVSDLDIPGQRGGGWGVWGEFEHNTPPTVDFLANGADTAEAGELDLIKVA